MSTKRLKEVAMAAAATALPAGESNAAPQAVEELIAKIKDKDAKVRYEALRGAGKAGAPAVKPLAATMSDPDFEVARAARRALWELVRYAGRPKADREARAVARELIALVQDKQPTLVRREAMWMLSELAGDEAVKPVAALLSDTELREDARMVLQRLPGKRSLEALQNGLKAAPEDFRPNIAVSLRERGVEVPEYPSKKLAPTRPTNVKPLESKPEEEKPKSRERKARKK